MSKRAVGSCLVLEDYTEARHKEEKIKIKYVEVIQGVKHTSYISSSQHCSEIGILSIIQIKKLRLREFK